MGKNTVAERKLEGQETVTFMIVVKYLNSALLLCGILS